MYSLNARDNFNCSPLLFSWAAPCNRCVQTGRGVSSSGQKWKAWSGPIQLLHVQVNQELRSVQQKELKYAEFMQFKILWQLHFSDPKTCVSAHPKLGFWVLSYFVSFSQYYAAVAKLQHANNDLRHCNVLVYIYAYTYTNCWSPIHKNYINSMTLILQSTTTI